VGEHSPASGKCCSSGATLRLSLPLSPTEGLREVEHRSTHAWIYGNNGVTESLNGSPAHNTRGLEAVQ